MGCRCDLLTYFFTTRWCARPALYNRPRPTLLWCCLGGGLLPGPLRPLRSTDIGLRHRHQERVGSGRARAKRHAGHRRRVWVAGDHPEVAAAAPDAGSGGESDDDGCVLIIMHGRSRMRRPTIEVHPNFSEALCLTPLEPQSRFGDKLLEIRLVCPQNETAVLKGVKELHTSPEH